MNGITDNYNTALDFAADKELGAFAITTHATVYLFDFSF